MTGRYFVIPLVRKQLGGSLEVAGPAGTTTFPLPAPHWDTPPRVTYLVRPGRGPHDDVSAPATDHVTARAPLDGPRRDVSVTGDPHGDPAAPDAVEGAPRADRAPPVDCDAGVEAKGLEPSNLLHAMQALYQLSYAPRSGSERSTWSPTLLLIGGPGAARPTRLLVGVRNPVGARLGRCRTTW